MSLTPEIAEKAQLALTRGQVLFTVVGGKMCSGKDTIAPALSQTGIGGRNELMRYGDLMRKDLQPGLALLCEMDAAGAPADDVIDAIGERMVLARDLTTELYEVLQPEVRGRGGVLTPWDRTMGLRHVLQNLGDSWRLSEDETYWAASARDAALERLAHGVSVILTGGRFLPDVELPRATGAVLLRLDVTRETQLRRLRERDGIEPTQETLDALDHRSETALDEYAHFDARIRNDVDGAGALQKVVASAFDTCERAMSRRRAMAA